MTLTLDDGITQIFENGAGDVAGICKDESNVSTRAYYFVVVRRAGEKGKTIKTRCNYETAYAIAKQFLNA